MIHHGVRLGVVSEDLGISSTHVFRVTWSRLLNGASTTLFKLDTRELNRGKEVIRDKSSWQERPIAQNKANAFSIC
jgi:hypothetical protein